MVVQKSTKIILWIASLVCLIFIGYIGVRWLQKDDATTTAKYEALATPVGVARAKQECLKEGLGGKVCGSIVGETETEECGGKVCWSVYAKTTRDEYAASITVEGNGDNLHVSSYLRDPGAH